MDFSRRFSQLLSINGKAWGILLLSLAFCFLIPSSSQLETDELYTAYFAQIKTSSEWLNVTLTCPGSDRQMPLTLFLDFAYGKLAGYSEWQLRSINILWGLISITSFYLIGRRLKMVWLPLLLSVQPFYWYYMDQARPYAMLIAFGSVILYTVVCCFQNAGKATHINLFIFFLAGFLLSAGSMMGFLALIPFLILLAWLVYHAKEKPGTGAWIITSAGLLLLFLLGLYYLSTLGEAGGAKVHKVGVANVLFPLHEFFGFSGLSPERFELRLLSKGGLGNVAHGLVSYLPLILPLLLSYLVIGISFLQTRKDSQQLKLLGYTCALFAGSFLIILIPAFVVKFPAWGRHFSAAFPSFVLLLGLIINQTKKTRLTQIAIGILFLLLFLSSYRLRFDSSYQREDYRSAAWFASEALKRHETVWWFADSVSSSYYSLKLTTDSSEKDKTLSIAHLFDQGKTDLLDQLVPPDWIVISQRLYVDRNPTHLTQYLERHHYKLAPSYKAFLIYKKSSD